MDVDAIRFSLEFIRTKFSEQTELQSTHIIEKDKANPLIGHGTGQYRKSYKIYDIFIRTNLTLFERYCFKEEIHKALLETHNAEELKIILQSLMRLAKQNIDLFEKLYHIKYNDGVINEFYECIPVEFGKVYFNIDDDKKVWSTYEMKYHENILNYSQQYLYRAEDLYIYCSSFYYFVTDLLKEWIELKELDKSLKKEQISSHKRELKKLYIGIALGFISSLATALIIAYFTYSISH